MAPVKCCVPGCVVNVQPQHRFPNPKKDIGRFKQWLRAINNPELSALDAQAVYDRKKICHCHFENKYFSAGAKRVHLNALPTLFLPNAASLPSGTIDTRSMDSGIPVSTLEPSDQTTEMSETRYVYEDPESLLGQAVTAPSVDDAVENTTSGQSDQRTDISENRNIFQDAGNLLVGTVCAKAGNSGVQATLKRSDRTMNMCGNGNTYEGQIGTPHQVLKSIGINIRKDMTPKKHQLYSVVKKLSRKLKKSNASKDCFRKRLFDAESFAKEKSLEENLNSLNKMASLFIRSQLREAGKPPKQHRFIMDDKILALTLFKKSPKAYRFLARIFALPSRSTLTNFLNEISFNAGINEEIFNALQETCLKLKPCERIVSLIWDEMSLAPMLDFNEKNNSIQGFHDFGNNNTTQDIADHVLVFMIRGLRSKIKQPISYSFSSKGGAKGHQIKKILKLLLNKLITAGLKPIVTICDQAATNVKVLNTLLKETKETCLKNGVEYREGSFNINGLTIYPIFDPPHLLKCMRNNFVDKTVSYGVGVNRKTANGHIL